MDKILSERKKMDGLWSLVFITVAILPVLFWVSISYGWIELIAVMAASLAIYMGFKFWLYGKISEKYPLPEEEKDLEVHP